MEKEGKVRKIAKSRIPPNLKLPARPKACSQATITGAGLLHNDETDSRPGGTLLLINHMGMCHPKGYGFNAVLV